LVRERLLLVGGDGLLVAGLALQLVAGELDAAHVSLLVGQEAQRREEEVEVQVLLGFALRLPGLAAYTTFQASHVATWGEEPKLAKAIEPGTYLLLGGGEEVDHALLAALLRRLGLGGLVEGEHARWQEVALDPGQIEDLPHLLVGERGLRGSASPYDVHCVDLGAAQGVDRVLGHVGGGQLAGLMQQHLLA
jgi:hypothetical protein